MFTAAVFVVWLELIRCISAKFSAGKIGAWNTEIHLCELFKLDGHCGYDEFFAFVGHFYRRCRDCCCTTGNERGGGVKIQLTRIIASWVRRMEMTAALFTTHSVGRNEFPFQCNAIQNIHSLSQIQYCFNKFDCIKSLPNFSGQHYNMLPDK